MIGGKTMQEEYPIYTAAHVANFFLKRAKSDEKKLDLLKLLKLVYIAFGWVYAFLDRKLFQEPIEAWKYGPVVDSLYHEFKHFGGVPIDKDFRATSFNLFDAYDKNKEKKEATKPEIPAEEKDLMNVLEGIWRSYMDTPPNKLVYLTHMKGTPWYETYDGSPSKEIPPSLIQKYYKSLRKPANQ